MKAHASGNTSSPWEAPLIPNPIFRALSMIRKHRVDHLLMGGQACILYGAAEFSRDLDLNLLPDPANLERLVGALADLQAQVIAIPPFEPEHLAEGLAVHFRCHDPDVQGLRIDVMTQMRGVDPFAQLWARRTTFAFDEERLEVLSLPDLVKSKKTQRDKDWPMIRRLLDVNYLGHRLKPTAEQIVFWLRELRTPRLLVEAVQTHPDAVATVTRQALTLATPANLANGALERALLEEEAQERQADKNYWQPLRKRLDQLRHQARG